MKDNLAIFYHIYQTNKWEELVDYQINLLQETNLRQEVSHLHIGINGSQPFIYPADSIVYNNYKKSERDTLVSLYNFCVKNPEYKVLYLHTKGVSIKPSERASNAILWREYLEYYNIKNWEECTKLLDTHDCVGAEWQTISSLLHPIPVPPHYSGNFWWANATYINKLDTSYLLDNTNIKAPWNLRHQCEFWIGSKNPNFFSFYSSNKNKYSTPILLKEYKKC